MGCRSRMGYPGGGGGKDGGREQWRMGTGGGWQEVFGRQGRERGTEGVCRGVLGTYQGNAGVLSVIDDDDEADR